MDRAKARGAVDQRETWIRKIDADEEDFPIAERQR
jgi:hypothetical protein